MVSTDQKKLSKIENELEERKQQLRKAQDQLEDKKAEADRAQVINWLYFRDRSHCLYSQPVDNCSSSIIVPLIIGF